VYAVERARVRDFVDLTRIAEANRGLIPTTRFRLESGEEAIRNYGVQVLSGFKRWDVRARLNAAVFAPGYQLTVERTVEPDN
jgi:hypothetical protein